MSSSFQLAFRFLLLCDLLCATAWAQRPEKPRPPTSYQKFGDEINQVRNLLHIPGMAAAIVAGEKIVWQRNFGLADVENKVPVATSTEFCIASVSKTMAAVVLMQLHQAGQIKLDDPIIKYLPESSLPLSITIRELMSHTSDGTPGEEFLYNGARYALLSRVIEKVTGKSYATIVSERILRPLKMTHTIPGLDAPGYETLQRELAKPYRWDPGSPGGIQPSDLPPPGLSAATGIVSTVSDLAQYAIALDGDALASQESEATMFTPTRSVRGEDLPYGLGWFVQNCLGQRLVWHFGQEDSYASLFLRVPQRKLTLIVLANSNAMSDAFRLLDGNAVRSLLALDFLRDVVLAKATAVAAVRDRLELDQNIDQALARIYLDRREEAVSYARAALESGMLQLKPEVTELYLLTRLRDPGFNQAAEMIGTELVQQHPHLSPALFYLGTYYQLEEQPERAMPLFERIAEIRPPLRHWTAALALLELGKWYAGRDPAEARKYLQQIIATGYNFNGAVDQAQQMLRDIPPP